MVTKSMAEKLKSKSANEINQDNQLLADIQAKRGNPLLITVTSVEADRILALLVDLIMNANDIMKEKRNIEKEEKDRGKDLANPEIKKEKERDQEIKVVTIIDVSAVTQTNVIDAEKDNEKTNLIQR